MKDEECESVDSTKYRGIIGTLLYLTASRPDIMFSVCLCARFQEAPKTSHLEAVKCIFRYIKGTTHLGLWYPKGTDIETVVYADSDHAGDYVDRKSTSRICTFVGCCLTSWFSKKQTALAISTTEAEYVSAGKACIIKERTTQKPDYVSEWCFDYAKQFVEQQLVPFYDHFKKHIQAANDTFFKEIREFEQIFDELEAEYEQCVLDNKNLTIEKKNLLIINECLIAECLEKDICSIVLTSDIVVPPSSNCLCEDLRSACDREHTKVLELEAEVLKQQKMVIEYEKRNSHLQKTHIDLQLKFQNYKQCIDTSSASNAIFEINKLRQQLQGKDDTIRNLDAQINIMKVLNVGSTEGSCDQQALETDRIQLKDTITSLRIQLDGLKVENVSLKRRYDELSKANTHSRTAYTEKINALTTEIAKLKTELSGKKSGGSTASEKPKVLAGMYNLGLECNARKVEAHHRTLNKKNRVDSNLLVKHSVSVSKMNNVCGACNKSLVSANHTDCLVMCDGSVNVKPHQTKRFKRQPRKEWKPVKKVWKPISKPVANSKPQWKPTGRHFSLFEKHPLTRIMESTDQPIELPPSASSSPKITMVSRFADHKVSDRQAGSTDCSMVSGYDCSSMMTDETPQVIEKFIVKTQRALNATVRFVRTDNGTEFVNKTLDGWFESVGISHETSVTSGSSKNGCCRRRKPETLMEDCWLCSSLRKLHCFLGLRL
ncbi:integrase, catalytic region, zinc finger, CCHC-type containing protein [Tanacetum coccineum]